MTRIKRTSVDRPAWMVMAVMMVLAVCWVTDVAAFQRQVTRTGVNGNSASRNTTVTRTDDGYQRDVVRQGPQGNTRTKSSQGQWDADSGTWTRQTTATNANGQSTSASSSVTSNDQGYGKTTTVTGPQGSTATRTVDGHWDANTNTWTKSVSTEVNQ
jgi:hypothetical protein